MTPDVVDLPEGYAGWPPSVRKRFWEELHAIYFPDSAPAAGAALSAVTPQPGDNFVVQAEIIG